ncbi:hypothetical protein NIES4074_22990 [Cylindrospermum sp. NIES-4074]|nr:hypothetical protein NIES4074_22990 [Cylindrospermum sp. NIES-4074]
MKYLPIIFVRGYAGTDKDVEHIFSSFQDNPVQLRIVVDWVERMSVTQHRQVY